MKSTHEKYIKRCLEIARLGKGSVSPNPMVGSVIVCDNKIIGEGYHKKHGGPHAEVNAINSVKNKSLLKKSTIYVSLEPCSHYGKTPPCADLIIKNKIPKVVIASIDSNKVVCGNGITKLKQAGIDVITGVLDKESQKLNKTFNTFQILKRPFIVLKWAETNNGFIDIKRTSNKTSALKISNNQASIWVHKLRSEIDAILIGTNTAILDNPSLTTRKWIGKNPIRIIIDKQLTIPITNKIFDQRVPTLVFNTKQAGTNGFIEHIIINMDNATQSILSELYSRNIQSLLVEGGAKTLQSFIDTGLWDEIYQIRASFKIETGIKAPSHSNHKSNSQIMGDNTILYYENIH